MSSQIPRRQSNAQLDALCAILGAAPVLSSENAQHYNEIWDNLIKQFRPKEFLELLLIRQVQNETWKIIRYTRHQTVVIDRRFQDSLAFQVRRAAEQKARKAAAAKEREEKATRPATDLQRLYDLNDTVVSLVSGADEMLAREPTEFDHNRALEASLTFQVQLDKLISSAWTRRNSALQQLEFCREDLGQGWRQFSDDVIDAATAETEELARLMAAPLTVPTVVDEASDPACERHSAAPESVVPPVGVVAPQSAGSVDAIELSDQEGTWAPNDD